MCSTVACKSGKARKYLLRNCLNSSRPSSTKYLSAAARLCLLKTSSITDLTSALFSSTELDCGCYYYYYYHCFCYHHHHKYLSGSAILLCNRQSNHGLIIVTVAH